MVDDLVPFSIFSMKIGTAFKLSLEITNGQK